MPHPTSRLPACLCLAAALASPAFAQTAGVARKLGPIPPVPALPPPPPIIPPTDLAPPHPTAPPPLPTISAHAAGGVSTLATATRITFGAGSTDLTPSTAAALHRLAGRGKIDPAVTYSIYAYAPGTPDDVSAPRRLSLERGLAIRSLLINAGIASTRIYVHALGARAGTLGAATDRADIFVGPAQTAPPSPASHGTAPP